MRFDVDRHGRLALGLEGGHSRRRVVHAGGSATGRRIVRELSALVAGQPRHRGARAARAPPRCTRPRAAVSASCSRTAARSCARGTVLATGGAAALWSRTTNPPGLARHRARARARGRRRPRRPRVPAVPPDRGHRRPAPRGLPRHRGDPRRGRHAARSGRRALRRGARAARRGRAGHLSTSCSETGATSVGLDMRAVDPARFPNVVEALREHGLDPTRELIPVSPAAHYMMGGVVTDLDARSTVPGPARRRRDRLHGPARREPPRVELASASASSSAPGPRPPALDEPAPAPGARPAPAIARAASARPAQATREALWRDAGLVRDAAGLRRLLDDPSTRSPGSSRRARCSARRAAGRTPDRTSRTWIPALDGRHAVIGADDRPILATWA